jgi:hypothetical protein
MLINSLKKLLCDWKLFKAKKNANLMQSFKNIGNPQQTNH